MSNLVANNTPADASYEIKVVDGILYISAQADVVKTIQDLISKNTSNPFVKFAVTMMGTLKTQLDWDGTKKELNV